MFGCQIVMNLTLSFMLFDGLLGEYGIFAFFYPFFVIIFLVADMFFTMLSTGLIVHYFQNRKSCIISIVGRDLLIIFIWLCFLLYIDINVLTLWGTICYACPKLLKIIICDILNKQTYLYQHIEL
jgi:hypothetical protein